MKYRKKPVIIEAIQWTGNNGGEILAFCPDAYCDCRNPVSDIPLFIKTLEGFLKASEGDYIIKGVQGEFYPCKPDIFAETYEPMIPPKPLTLEQLREMDGDWVWTKKWMGKGIYSLC